MPFLTPEILDPFLEHLKNAELGNDQTTQPTKEKRNIMTAEKPELLEQFFVNPANPEPGLTATSASFLAALASQEVKRLEAVVEGSTFYDTHIELLSGSAEPRLVQKGKDKAFLEELSAAALRIGELRGFIAYVHEAVKERDRRLKWLGALSFYDWLQLAENKAALDARAEREKLERPQPPEAPKPAGADWAKTRLSVRELGHYLLLEATAATLGVYVHPDGAVANAKDDLAAKTVKPVDSDGSGRELTIRTYSPSVEPDLVYAKYNEMQQMHRTREAELNRLKAKLEIMAKNETLERNRRYREALVEHQKALAAYQVQVAHNTAEEKKLETAYADWLLRETDAVRNLKIVVPPEFTEVYQYLSSLCK